MQPETQFPISPEPGRLSLFDQPVVEVIKQRTSWRSYEPRPLSDPDRQQLETFIQQQGQGPMGGRQRFRLLAAAEGSSEELRGLGTYGFIRNPAGFVVGALEQTPGGLVDFGFVMERFILRATDLGLGTCWLGGSFSRSTFAARMEPREGEIVPAVFSVGHPSARRGALDRVVRWGAGSRRRKPWSDLFFVGDLSTPLTVERAGAMAEALEMVRLAPSASNRQPWRVIMEPGAEVFHFLLHREAGYGRNLRLLKLADLPLVDLGIAMCHMDVTTRETGLAGTWSTKGADMDLEPTTEYVATWTRGS